ncbi:hypothetical protein Q0Z83_039770 [Actinoplanes sichuanensis]|nr:hypothetical protein Q0Z83_039770 [Actinoplanes sichuanensis]
MSYRGLLERRHGARLGGVIPGWTHEFDALFSIITGVVETMRRLLADACDDGLEGGGREFRGASERCRRSGSG